MGTYVATFNVSPRLREGNLQRVKSGGGNAWPEDVRPVMQSHLDYVKGLKAEGKILVGGPMVDFDWVLIIYRADALDGAVMLAENDPAYKNGLFIDCRVVPWHHAV